MNHVSPRRGAGGYAPAVHETWSGVPARRRLPDVVADQLLTEIREGRFKPGQQLPTEPELARQMGVGRTSVREAIQKLRTVGVVEVRKGLGTFVSDGNPSDPILSFAAWSVENRFEVSDLFEARLALELMASSLAAQRATKGALAKLRTAANAHVRAEAGGSLDDLVDTDQAFHSAIVALGGNSLLEKLYEMLVPQIIEYRRVSLAIPGAPKRSGQDHLAVVEAIASRSPAEARNAMLDHLWTLYHEFVDAARVGKGTGKPIIGRDTFGTDGDHAYRHDERSRRVRRKSG